jgi:RimJ/RimL family protein N-acetyltransferase
LRQISNDFKDSTQWLKSASGEPRPKNAGTAGVSLWDVLRQALTTKRLILRRWKDSDCAPFRSMNADLRVMEFMPGLLASEESDRMVERIEGHFEQHGFGLFAAEIRESGLLAGFVGLAVPEFSAPFTPCVEIGWRLAREYWGQGLATEGAREVLRHAFRDLVLADVVSFTVPRNLRSRRVMERLDMARDVHGDFDNPKLPEGHPLRPHVLYRIERKEWESSGAALNGPCAI